MGTDGYWWIALGIGLAVSVVAVVMLQMFLDRLHAVERGVAAVWESATKVARNTATTWQLDVTASRLDALTEEALRHEQLLRDSTAASGGRP